MVLEIQFWSVNYTLVARTCKNKAKEKAKPSYIRFQSQLNVLNHISTEQNITFQHYYQSYCDYLLKMQVT